MLKEEEVISSLELENYLNEYINDSDNCLQEKIIMSSFLNDYMDKDLYVIEFIRDNKLYIRVENEDDEILSKDFFVGELVKKHETIEEFEIQDGTISTVAESKEQLKSLLDCGEFSQKDFDDQMEEFNMFSNDTTCCWASRVDWTDKFLDNAGMLYYEKDTGKVIDFIGYC